MKIRKFALLTVPMLTLGFSSCENLDLAGLANTALTILTTDYSNTAEEYQYDQDGNPIYGYDGTSAVYGYDADNNPIYSVDELDNATQVPDWEPTGSAASSSEYRRHSRRASRRGATPPSGARHRAQDGHLRASRNRKARPGFRGNGPGPRPEGRHARRNRDNDDQGRGFGPGRRNRDNADRSDDRRGGRGDRSDDRRGRRGGRGDYGNSY